MVEYTFTKCPSVWDDTKRKTRSNGWRRDPLSNLRCVKTFKVTSVEDRTGLVWCRWCGFSLRFAKLSVSGLRLPGLRKTMKRWIKAHRFAPAVTHLN